MVRKADSVKSRVRIRRSTTTAVKSPAGRATPLARIRRICRALPETSEKIAWGHPTFRVCGKIFVMFLDNHHRDGRVAIWCNAADGVQASLVASDPEQFFVPPYVGCRGWVGIRLDRGPDWALVAELVREAYEASGGERGS